MSKKRNKDRQRHGMQLITLCISTTMVLVLLGLVVLSVLTAHRVSVYMREHVEMTVFLSDTMAVENGPVLKQQIAKYPYAKTVQYFDKETMCQKMATEMGVDVEEARNYMTAELDIQVNAAYANVDSLKKVSDQLVKNPWVIDVTYPKEQIDGMNRILHPVMIVLLVLAALLIFICYTLINNSVRLGIYARRFTIHTMKLVGARWNFIRRPFLNQAIVIGLVSAILACGVLTAALYSFFRFEPGIRDILPVEVLAVTGVAVFVFGFVITLLCTLLSVNHYLRMKAGDLYKL